MQHPWMKLIRMLDLRTMTFEDSMEKSLYGLVWPLKEKSEEWCIFFKYFGGRSGWIGNRFNSCVFRSSVRTKRWTWQILIVIANIFKLVLGSPLQYSCLENPRDRGAWWAAIYGVAQSQIRLKRLSSSRPSAKGFKHSLT